WVLAQDFTAPASYGAADSIVVAGMGGSAIGADLVGGLLQDSLRVPLVVWRDYDLPAWVGPRTLVIASSYSGGTEETLSAAARAPGDRLGPTVPSATNGAKQLATALAGRVAIVYGGGFLAAVARRWKGQFNENAKHWAFYEALPELDHNAVMGYQFPADTAR